MTTRFMHILIIEDNPGDVELLEIAFEMNGFEPRVQVAENGEEALLQLGKLAGSGNLPDLVLLDLNMPRMTGFEVLEAMREQNFGAVPTVVWTSSLLQCDRERCLALGARDFLSKPERIGEYIKLVDHLKVYLPD
jgi:CheY-like chemotaxis protein